MIRTSGLVKTFRGARVLDGLDLEIAAGERVALVGANGAGKTTLIRCLLGEYVHEGQVSLGDLDPRAHRKDVLQRVGFVPQLPPPLRMRVGRLLGFAAEVCGCDTAPMENVAGRLGLDTRALWQRPFEKLSGGQKQKLLIAIALGRECDVLILDEPAANLDPPARRSFFDLLAERATRATLLLSSHRLDEVAALVTRVVELDRGRVVLDDRVRGAARLDTRLRCRIVLTEGADPVVAALRSWGLADDGSGLGFEGTIPGADRLRFLGALTRYSGSLRVLHLEETTPIEEAA
jgi:ABC-2 type transport system ATP-binding protein